MIKKTEVCFLFILFMLLFGLIIVNSSNASEIPSLESHIQNAEKERNELKEEKQEISSLNNKIRDIIRGQGPAKARFAQKDAQWKARLGEHNEALDVLTRRSHAHKKEVEIHHVTLDIHIATINAHNSKCAGTFEDENFVNSCNSQAVRLDQKSKNFNIVVDALNREKAKIDAEANRIDANAEILNKDGKVLDNEEALLRQIDASIKKQSEDLNSRTLEWSGKMKKNNALLNKLYAEREKISECLRSNSTPEGQKHCSNIPFDGVDPNLPHFSPNPGDKNVKPPFTMTPNE